MPVLNTSFPTPSFTVSYAGRLSGKCSSEYLKSDAWVETVKSVVKGVSFGSVDDGMVEKAKKLVLTMQQRLDLHVADPTRVDKRRRHHYSLDFVRDNIPAMAATLCFSDHIVDHLDSFRIDECLLAHPSEYIGGGFRSFAKEPAGSTLSSLEGSYLHYDKVKKKWIRTGKALGAGKDACFEGRGNQHTTNARLIKQMREH